MADEVSAEEQVRSVELRIPPGPRLGDKVVHVRNLKKAYGDQVLFEDLTFDLPPQAKLGVIGGNGRGKTTLLRLILGEEAPDAGHVEIGSTVVTSVIEQSRDSLDDTKTVFENVTEGNQILPFGRTTMDARAYVARFNFKGEDQARTLGECSGGMRNRVLLARMLRKPATSWTGSPLTFSPSKKAATSCFTRATTSPTSGTRARPSTTRAVPTGSSRAGSGREGRARPAVRPTWAKPGAHQPLTASASTEGHAINVRDGLAVRPAVAQSPSAAIDEQSATRHRGPLRRAP